MFNFFLFNFQIQDVQEQGTLISLNIDIRAPIVLVPQNSESTNLLAFKLGDLSLKNFFEDTEVSSGVNQNWDHMYLHLDSVQMLRSDLFIYLLPMKTAVDLWSYIIAMKLPSPHIPSLLEPL